MIGGGRRRTIHVTPATKSPHPTRHGRIVWAAVAFGSDAIGGGYDEIDRHRCTAAVAEAVPVQPTDRPRHPE